MFARLQRQRHLRYLEYTRRAGRPVIYDIDDGPPDMPEDQPDYKLHRQAKVRRTISRFVADADAVTVSTPVLAEKLAELDKHIHVLENGLNHRPFPEPAGRGVYREVIRRGPQRMAQLGS